MINSQIHPMAGLLSHAHMAGCKALVQLLQAPSGARAVNAAINFCSLVLSGSFHTAFLLKSASCSGSVSRIP